jgi:DNA-binding MarR family transcriptional regulator
MNLAAEIKKRNPFDSLEQEVFLNLLHTADRLSRDFEPLLRSSGLSPNQYNVLRILRGAGEGLACGEIVGRMITRDPDMTRLLDRIEVQRLITRRRPTRDRRMVITEITRKGLTLLARLDATVQFAHKTQLSHMGRQKLKDLLKLLEAARSSADEQNQP